MTKFTDLKFSNFSNMMDELRRMTKDERDNRVMSRLSELLKEARFTPYRDFRYDVLSVLTREYGTDVEASGSAMHKYILESTGHYTPYDASRDR